MWHPAVSFCRQQRLRFTYMYMLRPLCVLSCVTDVLINVNLLQTLSFIHVPTKENIIIFIVASSLTREYSLMITEVLRYCII